VMPVVGNDQRFAVEYVLDNEYGGEWLFGRVCFRIAGERVGDFLLGTSLRDFLFQIEQGRRDHGRRRSRRFESMAAREVVGLLEGALFGGLDTDLEDVAMEEQWARHRITPELDVFDGWRVYLVETEAIGRLLYGEAERREIHEFTVLPGECDKVLDEACLEIGEIYNVVKDTKAT